MPGPNVFDRMSGFPIPAGGDMTSNLGAIPQMQAVPSPANTQVQATPGMDIQMQQDGSPFHSAPSPAQIPLPQGTSGASHPMLTGEGSPIAPHWGQTGPAGQSPQQQQFASMDDFLRSGSFNTPDGQFDINSFMQALMQQYPQGLDPALLKHLEDAYGIKPNEMQSISSPAGTSVMATPNMDVSVSGAGPNQPVQQPAMQQPQLPQWQQPKAQGNPYAGMSKRQLRDELQHAQTPAQVKQIQEIERGLGVYDRVPGSYTDPTYKRPSAMLQQLQAPQQQMMPAQVQDPLDAIRADLAAIRQRNNPINPWK